MLPVARKSPDTTWNRCIGPCPCARLARALLPKRKLLNFLCSRPRRHLRLGLRLPAPFLCARGATRAVLPTAGPARDRVRAIGRIAGRRVVGGNRLTCSRGDQGRREREMAYRLDGFAGIGLSETMLGLLLEEHQRQRVPRLQNVFAENSSRTPGPRQIKASTRARACGMAQAASLISPPDAAWPVPVPVSTAAPVDPNKTDTGAVG